MFRSVSFIAFAEILSKVFPFLIVPFIVSGVGVENYGVMELWVSIGVLLSTFLTFSVGSAYQRFYLDDHVNFFSSKLFIHSLVCLLFVFFVFFGVWALFSDDIRQLISVTEELWYLYLVFVIASLLQKFSLDVLRVQLRPSRYSLLLILLTACNSLMLYLVVYLFKYGVAGYFFVFAATGFSIFLLLIALVVPQLKPVELDFLLMKRIFLYCLPLSLLIPFGWLNQGFDRYLLSVVSDELVLSQYAIIFKIVSIGILFFSAVIAAWGPSALARLVAGDSSVQEQMYLLHYSLCLVLLLGYCVLSLLSDKLVYFIAGTDFGQTGTISLLYFMGFSFPLITSVYYPFISYHLKNFYFVSIVVISSIFSLIFVSVGISNFGLLGGSIAVFLSGVLYSILNILFCFKWLSNPRRVLSMHMAWILVSVLFVSLLYLELFYLLILLFLVAFSFAVKALYSRSKFILRH